MFWKDLKVSSCFGGGISSMQKNSLCHKHCFAMLPSLLRITPLFLISLKHLTTLRTDARSYYLFWVTSRGVGCSRTVWLNRLTAECKYGFWRLLCCCSFSSPSFYLVAALIFVLVLTFISVLVLSYFWYAKIYRQFIFEPLHKPPSKQKKN